MKRTGIALTLFLVSFLMIFVARAQAPPHHIDNALDDLSARLGRTVTLTQLSNWRWEQLNFPDSSLGCDTVDGSGGSILGYRFELTYNSVVYDYRVAHGGDLVNLCGEHDPNTVTATPNPDDRNRLCGDVADGNTYMRSRIVAGIDIEVVQGELNLRTQPAAYAEILLKIPAGLPLRVVAGPDCVEGIVWWFVLAGDQTGYVKEGLDGSYLVEPRRPAALPDRDVLNKSNVRQLQEVARISGNFLPQHDWSADGSRLYLPGAAGSDSIWLYEVSDPVLVPQTLETDDALTIIRARPGSEQVLYGTQDGNLHLWDVNAGTDRNTAERLFFVSHDGAISALAFSPDGNYFVSAGRLAYTTMTEDRDWTAIVWSMSYLGWEAALDGHHGLIRDIAYSPDGSSIATGADDTNLRVRRSRYYPTELASIDLGAPVRAVAYSTDGELLAVGLATSGANAQIFSATSHNQLATYPMPGSVVTALAFSPNSEMLMVGAASGLFTVWDTRSHQPLLTSVVDGEVRDVSFSPDGSLIAISTDNHMLSLHAVPGLSG